MGLTFRLGQIPLGVFTDTSNNVGIGAAPSGTYKFQVTGASASNSIYAIGDGSSGGALKLKQYSSSAANEDGYSTISTLNTGVFYFTSAGTSPNFKNFVLNPSGLTDNTLRSYTLPNASGTLALTSDLSGYLPLTGGTLTGALYINYANPVLRFKGATLDGYIINSSDKLYIADYNTATKGMTVDLSTGALTQLGSGAVTLLGALGGTSASFSSSVEAVGYRATSSSAFGSTGVGTEIGYSGGLGYIQAYNRGTSTYTPIKVDGSTVSLQISGVEKLGIASTGAATFSSSVASASNFSVARNGSNSVQAGYILETTSGTLYLANLQLDTSGGLNTWTYNPTNGCKIE